MNSTSDRRKEKWKKIIERERKRDKKKFSQEKVNIELLQVNKKSNNNNK